MPHIKLFESGAHVRGNNPALFGHGNMESRAFQLQKRITSTSENPSIKKSGLGIFTPALPGQGYSEITFPTTKQESGMPGIRRVVETSNIEHFFDTDEFAYAAIAKAAFEHATGLPEPLEAAGQEYLAEVRQRKLDREKPFIPTGNGISNAELDEIFFELEQEFPE